MPAILGNKTAGNLFECPETIRAASDPVLFGNSAEAFRVECAACGKAVCEDGDYISFLAEENRSAGTHTYDRFHRFF